MKYLISILAFISFYLTVASANPEGQWIGFSKNEVKHWPRIVYLQEWDFSNPDSLTISWVNPGASRGKRIKMTYACKISDGKIKMKTRLSDHWVNLEYKLKKEKMLVKGVDVNEEFIFFPKGEMSKAREMEIREMLRENAFEMEYAVNESGEKEKAEVRFYGMRECQIVGGRHTGFHSYKLGFYGGKPFLTIKDEIKMELKLGRKGWYGENIPYGTGLIKFKRTERPVRKGDALLGDWMYQENSWQDLDGFPSSITIRFNERDQVLFDYKPSGGRYGASYWIDGDNKYCVIGRYDSYSRRPSRELVHLYGSYKIKRMGRDMLKLIDIETDEVRIFKRVSE